MDTRIIAATNRDLEEEVREGRFREDLFFRLEAFTLHVPPLRERGEDTALLAAFFLNKHSIRMNKKGLRFSEKALRFIQEYQFPGNVRELENAIERAVTFCDGDTVRYEDLPVRMREHSTSMLRSAGSQPTMPAPLADSLAPLAEIEQRYILHVLDQVGGNKRKAAEVLGISRRTLYRRLDLNES